MRKIENEKKSEADLEKLLTLASDLQHLHLTAEPRRSNAFTLKIALSVSSCAGESLITTPQPWR